MPRESDVNAELELAKLKLGQNTFLAIVGAVLIAGLLGYYIYATTHLPSQTPGCVCPAGAHDDHDHEHEAKPLSSRELREAIEKSIVREGDICYAVSKRDRTLLRSGNYYRSYRIYMITSNDRGELTYYAAFREGNDLKAAQFSEQELIVVGKGQSPTPAMPAPGSIGSTPVPNIGEKPPK